jgi:hypothetical protein
MKLRFIVCIIFLSLIQCKSFFIINSKNLAHTYKKQGLPFIPQYFVYHSSNSVSELNLKINSQNLLYAKLNNESKLTSKVLITCRLFPSYEEQKTIDSSSVLITDDGVQSADHYLAGKIDFRAKAGASYLLETTIKDLNRNI